MKILVGCDLGYQVTGPATLILNIQPAETPRQRIVRETLTITPEGARTESWTVPGTGNRYLRIHAEAGTELLIHHEAEVELLPHVVDPGEVGQTAPAELPPEALPHLWPSRFCESDRLERLALREFCDAPEGHARVTAVCNWVHDRITYLRGASAPTTTATDTLLSGAGVCRDFAHLAVALCRALGIPARFISAHAPGLVPPDFHAVFEAFLGGKWWLFDATRQAPLDALVRIGQGRDAAEAAFAEIHGAATPTTMAVRAEVLEGLDVARGTRTTLAVADAAEAP
ncbi:transglutaminase domain-containing protein [Muricoccus aerilatus]|uniref:transglutaminase domain-containing protein n=1 Tax=Muricoccus aerilatus TaxID=452982 RepID=UPI0005C1811A|nr:transglutaminase family protein [Roseomonas aerilata]